MCDWKMLVWHNEILLIYVLFRKIESPAFIPGTREIAVEIATIATKPR